MIQKILQVLNREFKLNRDDCGRIFNTPIPVTEEFSKESAFISLATEDPHGPAVRGIGMLNGILDTIGTPKIAVQFDGKGNFVGFCEYIPLAKTAEKKSKKKK